jgi:uncharacterized membrane protein YbhN (UPF0104 family)
MTKSLRSKILFIVTNVISLICLVWALRGADLGKLRSEIVHLDWRWVIAGMIFDVLVYVWHGYRWILVLRPVTPISLWDTVRSIYVGLFANEVLPLRAGEIIRCYLLAKWTNLPVSVTLASALIERIFDGIWLVACLFVTIRYVHLPLWAVRGAVFLTLLLCVCGVLLAIAMYWRQQTLDALLNAPSFGWVHTLIEDLHLIGHSRYLYYAALASLPYILIQLIPIYALIKAYAPLHGLSLGPSFALMVLLRLSAVVPQAPGNLGTFQGVTIVGLRLFGIARPIAARFSLILWAAITLPLLIVGFIAVGITGVKMGQLHKDAQAGMQQRKEPIPIDEAR